MSEGRLTSPCLACLKLPELPEKPDSDTCAQETGKVNRRPDPDSPPVPHMPQPPAAGRVVVVVCASRLKALLLRLGAAPVPGFKRRPRLPLMLDAC